VLLYPEVKIVRSLLFVQNARDGDALMAVCTMNVKSMPDTCTSNKHEQLHKARNVKQQNPSAQNPYNPTCRATGILPTSLFRPPTS
jgi:hypothetical protein